MKEFFEKVFSVTLTSILIVVIILMVVDLSCDPLDPKNSVNAIYLEDPTGTPGRFRTVYVNVVSGVELRVFEDIKYPGNELIMVATSRGLGITYVQHKRR